MELVNVANECEKKIQKYVKIGVIGNRITGYVPKNITNVKYFYLIINGTS